MPSEFTAFDVETTGFLSTDPAIWEIAMITVVDYKVVDVWVQKFKPSRPFTEGALRATKIDPDSLKNEPEFGEFLPQIYQRMSGQTVIGWNSDDFDIQVLKLEFARCEMDLPKFHSYDALKVARKTLDREEIARKTGNSILNLSNVAKYFDIPSDGAHRALADTTMLVGIVKNLDEFEMKRSELQKNEEPKDSKISRVAEKALKQSMEGVKALSKEATDLTKLPVSAIENDEDASKAAERIIVLKNALAKIKKNRDVALSGIKIITKGISELYKSMCLDPVSELLVKLEKERSRYLSIKVSKAGDIVLEAEKIGDKVFEDLKGKSIDAAILRSNDAYESKAKEAAALSVSKSEVSGNKLIYNEIFFTANIVNQDSIPIEFWSPDTKKIEDHAKLMYDGLGISVTIPGVELQSRFEIRQKKPARKI